MFIFLHSSQQIRMKVDVVLEQFNLNAMIPKLVVELDCMKVDVVLEQFNLNVMIPIVDLDCLHQGK